MNATTVTLSLPASLVQRAQEAGLLTDERIATLLEAELARQIRIEALFRTADMLASLTPPLTPEEIAQEIQDARDES